MSAIEHWACPEHPHQENVYYSMDDPTGWRCNACGGEAAKVEVVPKARCDFTHAQDMEYIRAKDAEVERLREDLAKAGAAFAELFSQGLNGVICDPAQEEIGRTNCRSCHEAWRDGQEVLRAYDPKFANLLRPGPMFQPEFDAA